MKRTIVAIALIASLTSATHAGGFLANTFIRPISPKAADAADKAHKKVGNPLDHAANVAAGIAANAVVPGSGPAVAGALEGRDAARKE
jgi:hypothetical protein